MIPMLRLLQSNRIVVDLVKLVSGTAAGRIIFLIAMPFVTRMYDPADFELLAIYTALVSTVAVAACLRLEIAIPLAYSDEEAANLLGLSLLSVFVVSALLAFAPIIAPRGLLEWSDKLGIKPYFWLVSFGVALSASYSVLQQWATRKRQFGSIARTRVGQASIGAMTMISLGWFGLSPLGLLLGHMFSSGVGGGSLAVNAVRENRDNLREVRYSRMSRVLRKNYKFPLFSMPEALANVAGLQIPIILIASSASEDTGQLFLAMQVVAAPMALLGSSVSQVYVSRARDEMGAGTLSAFTFSIMRKLLFIGAAPIALSAILAPFVFPFIFGVEWSQAGWIVSWIAPWMLIQLVVSPVSMGLHITGKQSVAMGLQFFGLIMRCAAVLLASLYNPSIVVEAYAIASALFYCIYGVTIIINVGGNDEQTS